LTALIAPWRRMFDFSGRSRRSEYWSAMAQYWIVCIALLVAMVFAVGGWQSVAGTVVFGVSFLAWLVAGSILTTAAGIRRCHDMGVTGWLVLLLWIPYAGWVATIVIGCIPPAPAAAAWGPDPRGGMAGNIEQVFS
jgi:uncharacterized membrane protein YhaH (DUF805 family)